MPIYAYRCTNCGHAQDVLQKLSDPVLTVCPSCGQPTYAKQVTAAGFQLKGSGWYVTDFRNDGKGAKKADGDAAKPNGDAAASGDAGKGDAGKGDGAGADAAKKGDGAAKESAAPAASAPAPAPAAPAPSTPSKSGE